MSDGPIHLYRLLSKSHTSLSDLLLHAFILIQYTKGSLILLAEKVVCSSGKLWIKQLFLPLKSVIMDFQNFSGENANPSRKAEMISQKQAMK